MTLYNELAPREVEIWDARGLDATLSTRGFELMTNLRGRMPEATSLIAETEIGAYKKFLEDLVMKKMGASFARAFCLTARNVTQTPSTMGSWAHTDIAPGSWATKLRELDNTQLPPGLSSKDADIARNAKRVAVVTAWRYLGPEPTSKHSHLAMLDHDTLNPDDAFPFILRDGNFVGHNYRLALNDDDQHHRWYYFPEMDANDEVLLFIAFDTQPSSFASADKLSLPTLIHSAFLDPDGAQHPVRQSMDIRILLAWD